MSPEERRKAILHARQLIDQVALDLLDSEDEYAGEQCGKAARALERVLRQWKMERESGNG
jgi:hypothetical protein